MRNFILGFLFFTAALASAGQGDLQDRLAAVNERFEKIFAMISNEYTQGQIEITRFAESDERILAVRVAGFLRKSGPVRALGLEVDEVSYDYGDGSAPKTAIKGGVTVDISQFSGFKPEMFDMVVEDMDSTLKAAAAQYLADYGDAVQVSAVVEEKNKDEKNHYQSIKAKISLKFDLTKLPSSMPASEVIFTSVNLSLDLNLKTGLKVAAELVSNTSFAGFQEDQKGLKELFQDMMNKDPNAWSHIESGIFDLSANMDRFVNEK